jgi:hypothetical protein
MQIQVINKILTLGEKNIKVTNIFKRFNLKRFINSTVPCVVAGQDGFVQNSERFFL